MQTPNWVFGEGAFLEETKKSPWFWTALGIRGLVWTIILIFSSLLYVAPLRAKGIYSCLWLQVPPRTSVLPHVCLRLITVILQATECTSESPSEWILLLWSRTQTGETGEAEEEGRQACISGISPERSEFQWCEARPPSVDSTEDTFVYTCGTLPGFPIHFFF